MYPRKCNKMCQQLLIFLLSFLSFMPHSSYKINELRYFSESPKSPEPEWVEEVVSVNRNEIVPTNNGNSRNVK